jgi:hypothetical protein
MQRIFQNRIGRLFLIGILGLIAGCAEIRQMTPLIANDVPPIYELESVPFFPQETHQCGPAALAMVLHFTGLPMQPDDVAAEVYTPSLKGSLQMAMVGAARRHGRLAYEIADPDSICYEISAGYPVIVLQNSGFSWYPVWHYAVVIGYDLTTDKVVLRSGTHRRKLMAFKTFEKTWAASEYWGILVLKPDQLPARVQQKNFLTAVVGLEKVQQFEAAITGYHTALKRWPASLPARMGLGNSYYAVGDLSNAERIFRETVRLHPDAGSGYNNLAQVLMEQGRQQEALETAKKAVSIGGPLKGTYEETLRAIETEMSH